MLITLLPSPKYIRPILYCQKFIHHTKYDVQNKHLKSYILPTKISTKLLIKKQFFHPNRRYEKKNIYCQVVWNKKNTKVPQAFLWFNFHPTVFFAFEYLNRSLPPLQFCSCLLFFVFIYFNLRTWLAFFLLLLRTFLGFGNTHTSLVGS